MGRGRRAFWQPAELSRRAAFWKSQLAGSTRLWSGLRRRRPRARATSAIPVDSLSRAYKCRRDLARPTGATLFSTLLAAFQVTLVKWTGQG